ncbi:MAG TPA: 6-carboxytetrahydropterin synthase [Gemmatimonadales bacterium]|nr:6-carboxytetrahydropterin synthase [Gemmatimonadales bacterium]
MSSARGRFRVSVSREDLVFAAAHFITLPGHRCEALHGHNYRAGVVLEGSLEPEVWFVYDFVALKKLMRRLTDELDHRVLLPQSNPTIGVHQEAQTLTVVVGGKTRYTFPASDCVLLPIPNTTVELLAEYLAGRVRDELRAAGAKNLRSIQLEVEENFGQSATYREELGWG